MRAVTLKLRGLEDTPPHPTIPASLGAGGLSLGGVLGHADGAWAAAAPMQGHGSGRRQRGGSAREAGGCPPALPPPRRGFQGAGGALCVCRPAGSLPYEYKIVIAGNHELTFDQEFMADLIKQDFYYFPSVSKLKPENYENVQSLLTNCIYLQDSEVTVRGFRIYGSPW